MNEPVTWSKLTAKQRDALIHEKVMQEPILCSSDLEPLEDNSGFACPLCRAAFSVLETVMQAENETHLRGDIPPYSTSMDAAWIIVEKMVARMGWLSGDFTWDGPRFKAENRYFSASQHIPDHSLTWHFDHTQNGGFRLNEPCWYVELTHQGHDWKILADTPQEAICLAALDVEEREVPV